MTYVIEFRSGTYYQSRDADNGGPMATAQRFDSAAEVDAFMSEKGNEWILFCGGMAVPAKDGAQ